MLDVDARLGESGAEGVVGIEWKSTGNVISRLEEVERVARVGRELRTGSVLAEIGARARGGRGNFHRLCALDAGAKELAAQALRVRVRGALRLHRRACRRAPGKTGPASGLPARSHHARMNGASTSGIASACGVRVFARGTMHSAK